MTIRWAHVLRAVVVSFVLIGCSSEPDRQWYKPNSNYTVAAFKRDRDECTKDNMLDEECLKQHGWVPLTLDPNTPPKGKAPTYRR